MFAMLQKWMMSRPLRIEYLYAWYPGIRGQDSIFNRGESFSYLFFDLLQVSAFRYSVIFRLADLLILLSQTCGTRHFAAETIRRFISSDLINLRKMFFTDQFWVISGLFFAFGFCRSRSIWTARSMRAAMPGRYALSVLI